MSSQVQNLLGQLTRKLYENALERCLATWLGQRSVGVYLKEGSRFSIGGKEQGGNAPCLREWLRL